MLTHWPFWHWLLFWHGLQPVVVVWAAVTAHGVVAAWVGAGVVIGRMNSHLLPAVFGPHLQKKRPLPSE